MSKILAQSKDINHEYCCTVVRIGELIPIEGKDRIVQTLVNGLSMVVRKDQVNEGDVMILAMNETQLNEKFLSANNLFDIDSYEKNKNAVEVGKILLNGDKDEARNHCGFFNKHGRVKLKRLGGIPSYGYLFTKQELEKVYPKVKDVNLEEMINQDFDTVCGELFVKVYTKPVKLQPVKKTKMERFFGRLRKFNRMLPGKFIFHYDTAQLARNIRVLNYDTEVTCSVKEHGTSAIFANILTKKPKFSNFYAKIFVFLPKFLQFYTEDYDLVYSSRTVIKNADINNKVKDGFYGKDIWGEYAQLLKNLIPKGMTVYGEIVGYMSDDTKMIQKDYDYGCFVGTNKLMPYRISSENEDGTHREWDVQEVYDWTINLINNNPYIANRITPIQILYQGKIGNLYPELNPNEHWHENLLDKMKNDKKNFGMEMNEPLCKNKVPREGIVLRINGDIVPEAWKLKCSKFMLKESEEYDNEEYSDTEELEK